MKNAQYVALSILLLFVIGCATQQIQVTDQVGREIPTPHYFLKTIDNNIRVLYYWSYQTGGTQDLDGTRMSHPVYFDFTQHAKISTKEIYAVTLTLEIANDKLERYELWERSFMKDRQGRTISRGGLLAYSNQRYRQHRISLPLSPDLQMVEFAVDLVDGTGMPIMRFGEFKYDVKNPTRGGERVQFDNQKPRN